MLALLSAAVLGAGGGVVARFSCSFSDSVNSFSFCSCAWLPHLQLRSVFSDAAVEGALSTSLFSGSDAEESAVTVVLTDCIDSEVDVRFIGVLPVKGGDCSDMDLRKSK
jgi:hypothetical protein